MSCLFKSIAFFFKKIDHKDVRAKICSYLEKNKPLLDGLETNSLLGLESKDHESYIRDMRKNSTWGGGIEIRAACNIWRLRIVVVNIRDNTRIEFLPLSNAPRATIEISWNGSHYEPLRKYT